MPKSIEGYQQETGRAGRDGLEAECVLFYSGADFLRWEALMQRSADEAEVAPEVRAAAVELLERMRRYCGTPLCRHRMLSEYFGQEYPAESCNACDVCLGEAEGVEDATVSAQKILSCIARTGERFGVTHIVDVLAGAQTEAVRRWRHEQQSTYGLLRDTPRKLLTSMIYQLVDANLVDRTPGDRPTLRLNDSSWEVLRGQRTVRMLQPRKRGVEKTKFDQMSWEGVDRDLFERLRALRREIAAERAVPPYLIFNDATLRELARGKPRTLDEFRGVRGVGERKLADLGERFVACIAAFVAAESSRHDATLATRTDGVG
jgi:ATP-dependent DNA helicase RecQ